MSEGVSGSRFNMWRAVFAMAHADHVVTDEEKQFMENYLEKVSFSEEQRDILRGDMTDAQDAHEMFGLIEDAEDRSMFFQFARELVWCDGDLDAQEEKIKERLKAGQMDRLGRTQMETELHKSRAESRMRTTAEKRQFKKEAGKTLGFGSILKVLFSPVLSLFGRKKV